MPRLPQYVEYVKVDTSESGKTDVWWVTTRAGVPIGEIKWFGRWRRYCYFPWQQTVLSPDCIRNIAAKCEDLTTDHRLKGN